MKESYCCNFFVRSFGSRDSVLLNPSHCSACAVQVCVCFYLFSCGVDAWRASVFWVRDVFREMTGYVYAYLHLVSCPLTYVKHLFDRYCFPFKC